MTFHLIDQVIPILSKSDDERISYVLRDHWIGYANATNILRAMDDLLCHPKVHRMPNMLIKSATNNGKSSLLQRFKHLHPSFEDETEERIKTPVLFIEVPPDPSPDALYSLILQGLCIGYKESYSKEVKAQKAFEAIAHHGVRMLLIDELHVVMNTTKVRKAQMLDALKYISNRAQVPIVAAGTVEAHTAILSDLQLANRFKPYELPSWKLDNNFLKLVNSFERILPLEKSSKLTTKEIAIELYGMSNGWIGELKEILQRATVHAIRSGDEKITMDTLKELNWLTPEQRRTT